MFLTNSTRIHETVLRTVWLIPFARNVRIKMMPFLAGAYSNSTCYRITYNFCVRSYGWNSMSCCMEEIKPHQECYILLPGIRRKKGIWLSL